MEEENSGILELLNPQFEYIRVSGLPTQFGDLKRFCGNDITITYESCMVDDYWLIQLYDCLKEKKVVVPNFDYIIKLPAGFTIMSREDILKYFVVK